MSKRLVGLAVLITMMLTACGEDENQAPVQAIGEEEFQSYIKEV